MIVCKECSSDDIFELKWVGINSGKIESGLKEKQDRWCNKCESHTDFIDTDLVGY